MTHGVFPNESWRKFVDNPLFEYFWLTDSVTRTASAVAGKKPFEVRSRRISRRRALTACRRSANISANISAQVLSIAPLVGNLITGDRPLVDPISAQGGSARAPCNL